MTRIILRLISPSVRAALVVALVGFISSAALADGPRPAATRKKTLVESTHFGSYYVPQVVTAGRNVVVFWRGPDQSGTQRTYAISKNGGKSFGAVKSIRIPVLFQLVAIVGDSAGNIYYAGTTGFANQIAVVRSDSQVRNFTSGTFIDSDRNIVGIDLATTPTGHLYLAYQTAFAVQAMGGGTTTAEQVNWSVSTDLGVAFAEFVPDGTPRQRAGLLHEREALVAAAGILARLELGRRVEQAAQDGLTGVAGADDVGGDAVEGGVKEIERHNIHGAYAAASYTDDQIGTVLDELQANGLDKNAIIILWGDHGWHLGDHGMWCKHTNYEQAAHIPLIVSAPGAKPARTKALVEKHVAWFKAHRRILEADLIHLRRADGRDWDGVLHVDPMGDERALLAVWNPLPRAIERRIRVPLRYAGLRTNCRISIEGGASREVSIDGDGGCDLLLTIPAHGSQCVVFR